MVEIIPSILVEHFDEFKQKFESVKNLVSFVQLDVADGVFAPHKTWGDPLVLKKYKKGKTSIEVHLMVANPEKELESWLCSGAERIYVHYESTKDFKSIILAMRSRGIKPGLALLPETQLQKIFPFLSALDAVLFFAGKLGFYGGKFREDTIERVKELRGMSARINIGVDGGINLVTGKKCAEAGANLLVAGSYIFNSGNITGAIEELREAVKEF
jgi:ribulose-phosphate 3-epimerase